MRRTLLSAVLIVSSVIAFFGAANASASAKSRISIHVTLSRMEVKDGSSIHGEVILTNSGTKTFVVQTCASDGWLFVGLANTHVSFTPAVISVACWPTIRLKPGLNRFAISVSTRYQKCGTKPRCTKSGLPELPKGRYHTAVEILGLPPGTPKPPPISVLVN